MRSPLSGCDNGLESSRQTIDPNKLPAPERSARDEVEVIASIATLATRGWVLIKPGEDNLIKKVKALRDAQNMHAKTLNYGYRNLALRLGKEVDEMLDKLKIE